LTDSFTIADLARVIGEALGLKPGDTIEVQRNRLNRDELKVIRHPGEVSGEVAASPASTHQAPTPTKERET
jgi:hypothetical protein